MRPLILQPTTVAEWYALVKEVENISAVKLKPDLEHYLVLLLQYFIDKPEVLSRVFAVDYLNAQHHFGSSRYYELREVGDGCLLIAGFFPQHAEKVNVSADYFIDLGQRAYAELSHLNLLLGSLTELYAALKNDFVQLMDILLCMRGLADKSGCFSGYMNASPMWN